VDVFAEEVGRCRSAIGAGWQAENPKKPHFSGQNGLGTPAA
jgi:hypothetical protein